PAACAAVRGRFGRDHLLGAGFKQCVALVSLMLKGCGSLDLLLITKTGELAIGECKLRDHRDPEAQLKKYRAGLIAAAADRRLWQEVERSYGRYDAHHLCVTVRAHFNLPDAATWCRRVERNARAGRITTFVLRGDDENPTLATMTVDGRAPQTMNL